MTHITNLSVIDTVQLVGLKPCLGKPENSSIPMTHVPHRRAMRVFVEQILPFGLLVRLEDNSQGLIREREIAWEHHARRYWREHFRVGDELEAVELADADTTHQRIELSLRLAQSDPWEGVKSDWLGRVIAGIVTGVQPYGAFVEIEPGIVGLLHESRLPDWVRSAGVEDLFWVGDRVRVAIERIDTTRRQIALSLSRALVERWPARKSIPQIVNPVVPGDWHDHSITSGDDSDTFDVPYDPTRASWRILVVEDDNEQRRALVAWLRDTGHIVYDAAGAEAGLAVLESERIDLLLSDYGLPDQSGIDLIYMVRQRWPQVRCTLVTDWAQVSVNAAAVDELRGRNVALVLKPLQPADIEALLLDHPFDPAESIDLEDLFEHEAPDVSQILRPAERRIPTRQALSRMLERVRRTIHATRLILFALDTATRHVTVLAEAGSKPLNRSALTSLIYSPVRDVAEDGVVFRVDDASQSEQRVRYLRPLLSFEASAGVPVAVDVTTRFALFAFRSKAEPFTDNQVDRLNIAAYALATTIEREEYLGRAADTHRQALLGQLSSALVHEMNHVLTSLNFTLPNMEHLLTRVTTATEPGRQKNHDEMLLYATMTDLRRGIERLTDTARMFGKLTIQTSSQIVDLGETLHEVIDLVQDMAERQHVEVTAAFTADLPAVAVSSVQLQQILLNILINAIQQIGLARPTSGGMVIVRTAMRTRNHRKVICIEVEDDGPGIHRQLWERIFELGFTTRSEAGSGLGLYISRSLAEPMEIRVAVAESYRFWGTIFVIELPLVDMS